MALLQISEPGNAIKERPHRLAVGIDLGTSNSLVATIRDGRSEVLSDEQGVALLPSVVRYLEDASTVVGDEAIRAAENDPLNTISSIKRLMGRGLDDVTTLNQQLPYHFSDSDSSVPRIQTVAGDKSPVEISAEILKALKRRAEKALGGALEGVVITVPAYFDDAQRQATRDAARLAGLNVSRMLNEPTAAALAYGLDRGAEGIHVIYDLGGGTFDVSVLRFSKGLFEVLATAGDSALGGDDFDAIISEWIIAEAGLGADEALDHALLKQISRLACQAKEGLSTQDEVTVKLTLKAGEVWKGSLSRTYFNELVTPLVKKTLAPCRRAMRDAGIENADIADVVMVGGSTRIPLVCEQVGQFFDCTPHVEIDPDKVVALGAAIQANVLVGNKTDDEVLLLDVTPLSLGIETMGGLVEKVISRNTAIPVIKAQEFTTYKDGQTAMSVHVLQGERERVEDCRSLARFDLKGIPSMVAGAARIKVMFQVDADGLLTVSAREETLGIENRVEVKPAYGLSDNEISQMLRDSISNADEDVKMRRLIEMRVEANRLIEGVQMAMSYDSEKLLSASEKADIEAAIAGLNTLVTEDDYMAIKKGLAALDQVSSEFAARRMDMSIREALTGHTVDEFVK